MAEIKDEFAKALTELRAESKKRKFSESVDLVVNLRKFNIKKESVNTFVVVPNKIKDKKVCAFLEVKNSKVDTVTRLDFKTYSDKKELKNLARKYDFFIAEAALMPAVATTFGRVLGPLSKMPSPQLGVLMTVDDKTIIELLNRINHTIKVRTKEASLKFSIGRENMKDEEILDNLLTVYNAILKALPRNKENIKNVGIKFSMSKPKKIRIN